MKKEMTTPPLPSEGEWTLEKVHGLPDEEFIAIMDGENEVCIMPPSNESYAMQIIAQHNTPTPGMESEGECLTKVWRHFVARGDANTASLIFGYARDNGFNIPTTSMEKEDEATPPSQQQGQPSSLTWQDSGTGEATSAEATLEISTEAPLAPTTSKEKEDGTPIRPTLRDGDSVSPQSEGQEDIALSAPSHDKKSSIIDEKLLTPSPMSEIVERRND